MSFCRVSQPLLWEQMPEAILNPLQSAVATAFAGDGPLARDHPSYVFRQGQLQMAQAVADAVATGGRLVVEAGTGIGKTYAYLVPALLSGRQVVVCTATKTLQDQLYQRDVPQVLQRLGLHARVALLKGRSSYLCLERLRLAGPQLLPTDRHGHETLRKVEAWGVQTPDGDLSEAGVLPEQSPLWPLVTSTTDNCLGANCPRIGDCHLYAARRRAAQADLVIANHHLFFADRALREVADGGVLPTPGVWVFDEAHHLVDTAARFAAQVFGGASCREWGREGLRWALSQGADPVAATASAVALEMALNGVQACLPPPSPEGLEGARTLSWQGATPDGVALDTWQPAVGALAQAIDSWAGLLRSLDDGGPDARALLVRGQALGDRMQVFLAPEPGLPGAEGRGARWVECVRPFRWLCANLGVPDVWDNNEAVGQATPAPAWIFTSATLGAGDDFTWFTKALGLEGGTTLRVPSPFDHQRQAAWHVPADLPLPMDPAHPAALAQRVWPWVQRLRGRTLVLCTTHRAVQQMAAAFRTLRDPAWDPQVLSQDKGAKADLLARFRQATAGDGAVLVATASFWEGVDLPGDLLQMLVIDKLPFSPPDDPWVQARWRAEESAGRSPFRSMVLPAVAITLRQGVGRLIRSETDQGLLVVGDRRLVERSYGAYLRRALPAMPLLDTEAAVQGWLDGLVTTASTKDHPWF